MPAHGQQSADVVVVFVRDEDGIQVVEAFSNGEQSFANFATAEPGVDQDTRLPGTDECRITAAAAGQNTDLQVVSRRRRFGGGLDHL